MTEKTQLRSREWFDNPANPDMTALYLERYLNYGLSQEELQSGKPIIAIAQTGSDLSPCNRHHIELAKRVRDGIREAGESRSRSRSIRFRKPASAPPRRSTATWPTWVWSNCSMAIPSTASC
ncbi:dihydroxy-acid dehydratase domain-containing protein [Fodinicurvata halophila]